MGRRFLKYQTHYVRNTVKVLVFSYKKSSPRIINNFDERVIITAVYHEKHFVVFGQQIRNVLVLFLPEHTGNNRIII